MEGGGHLGGVAVQAGGIPLDSGQADLLGQAAQVADQVQLGRLGQQGQVGGAHIGGDAVLGQGLQDGLDAGVGVLDIVHRILAVGAHGQAQVKLDGRGGGAGIEEEAGGVHAHLVQQVVEGDGVAGALGHTDGLAVPHELHQLHQHDLQPVGAVQAQGVQGAFQPGHMAVVVGAPDVDDPVKAPDGELVAVVGDIGGEVGVEAVGPAEDIVLQVQLLHVGGLLPGFQEVLPQDVRRPEPEGPVLLIGPAPVREELDGLGHIAALMEGGLVEPGVVADLVAGQVTLHLGEVHGKAEPGQLLLALGLADVQQLLSVEVIVGLGQVFDVAALVAVLREGDGVLAVDELEVAHLNGAGELIDLVAGVVDVELPADVRPAEAEDGGQGITQDAAPGVAHVHGAGGVGGDKLHHDLLPVEDVGAAVVLPFGLHGGEDIPEPGFAQAEVQKAGARDLGGGEVAAAEVQVGKQRLRDLAGRQLQLPGAGHGDGAGEVAVGGILGDLHGRRGDLRLGQLPGGGRGGISRQSQTGSLIFRVLDHMDHSIFSLPRTACAFHSFCSPWVVNASPGPAG